MRAGDEGRPTASGVETGLKERGRDETRTSGNGKRRNA